MTAKEKYCHIYLVRHGQTDNNKNGVIQGSAVDAPLNQLGQAQSKKVAQQLKPVPFAAAFSSDLLRAKATAEIISLEHQLTVVTKRALRERGFGQFEGKQEKYLQKKLKHLLNQFETLSDEEKFKFKFPHGIEDLDKAVSRLINFLRQISLAYLGKTVLVVTHGSLMRHFLIHIGLATYQQFNWSPGQPPPITNLGYAVLDCDGVEFFVKKTLGIKLSL